MTSGRYLHKNLETFLGHIDAIRDTLSMTMYLILPYNQKANDDYINFLKESVEEIEDENGKKRILVKADESKVFESLERNASTSALASKIIPESLFVSLISQYDEFLTRLLCEFYVIKPDILNSYERNFTFSQLVDVETRNNAIELIIKNEIDTVLRKSYSEQFDYLEKHIGRKLRSNLPIWQTFIEITERRNLLVHNDGIVSVQYLKNCSEHECNIDEVEVGDRLGVESQYFSDAYNCMYELATILTHTIWRKYLMRDLENADRELNDICLHLINTNSFLLADILLKFGFTQEIYSTNYFRNAIKINGALSKYLQNKKAEIKRILFRKDFGANNDASKLAYAILTDDYERAYEIMIEIGDSGEVDKSDYRQWPLFNMIRKEDKFKETYRTIFKEDYTVMETPIRPLQELINKEIKRDIELK